MPGMMDTILNLGLNEDVVNTIAEKSKNPRWAWDCYRRFIQMFSDVLFAGCGITRERNARTRSIADMLLHPQFDPKALKVADKENVVGKGIAASPGAAAGSIVFTAEDAVIEGKKGNKVVLVRLEKSHYSAEVA